MALHGQPYAPHSPRDAATPEPGAMVMDAAQRIKARGIRTIVLKRGAAGASLFQTGLRVDAPPTPVGEVDLTSADDAFREPFSGSGRPGPSGIPSICTLHSVVIEAAMRAIAPSPLPLLIEATCNQVNQDGGHTGMTPADFRRFVLGIAVRTGFAPERMILGGDHLRPNQWENLPAYAAMAKAETMIRDYAAAGFSKLHLDCSMGYAGDPVALDDTETAARAARLSATAEATRPAGGVAPVYIIGTEVPIPGGAMEEIEGVQGDAPRCGPDHLRGPSPRLCRCRAGRRLCPRHRAGRPAGRRIRKPQCRRL